MSADEALRKLAIDAAKLPGGRGESLDRHDLVRAELDAARAEVAALRYRVESQDAALRTLHQRLGDTSAAEAALDALPAREAGQAGAEETKAKHVPHAGPSGATCWGTPHCTGGPPHARKESQVMSTSDNYVSTGDPADDHMIEGIPADSAYQDDIEAPSFRDRYARRAEDARR